MRKALLAAALLLGAALALAGGLRAGDAAPAPDHPYFADRQRGAPRPSVIAHRGGMGRWPENTLTAFREALAVGADALDLDVRASADGALVVFHDAELGRTTDGSGPLAARSLPELQSLDAGFGWSGDGGASHPFRGRGIRIPTLEEVFRALPEARLGIEIKPRDPALAEKLCRAIRAAHRQERVLVASFVAQATRAFRAACPEVATGAVFSEALRFTLLTRLGLAAPPPPDAQALLVPIRFGFLRVPGASFARAAHRRNLRVQAWLANERPEMEALLEAGVDGIITDYPDRLLALLRERGMR